MVVKTGPAQAAPGDLATYTLTYTNIGGVKSTSVVLKDFLPNYVAVLTNSLGDGSLAGSTVSWNLGTVSSSTGGSRSFQVRLNANAPSGSFITNRAQIFGVEAEEAGKTNNNYATLITRIINNPPEAQTNFCMAILAKQPINLHGTMLIDSFNSLDPNFSTNGRYDPSKRGDGADVASASDSVTVITDTGNTKVYGRFATGPTGNIKITGNAAVGSLAWVDGGNRGIQPGWYLNNLAVGIPDASLPNLTFSTLTNTSGKVNGTNYTYVITSGNYQSASSFSLSSSQNVCINGNVVLYFPSGLQISGQAYIYITPGSRLTVYLGGQGQLSGGGTINGSGFATNCAYVGLPSCSSLSFSGNSEYIGTVYAPQAAVQMTGGGSPTVNFIGAVVANAVDISGSYEFHYDQSLCLGCVPPMTWSVPASLTNCFGSTVSFNVSVTGTGLGYQWYKGVSLLNGQTNSSLVLSNVSSGDIGNYQVVVAGSCGTPLTNSATLTVTGPPTITCPPLVTVAPNNGQCAATNVNLGTPVTGDNCGPTTITNNAPSSYPVGTNLVTWTVRDANGNMASCLQTVIVTDNQPPTVSITSPTNGAVFVAPANFTLLAEAHDPDGTIAKVEFFSDTNKLGEATNGAPYFIVLTNVPIGAYTLVAAATDGCDLQGTSAPVNITVIERPPLTVIAVMHYNPQTDFFEETVRITNPTYSTFEAVRVYVSNLTNNPAITVHNLSGMSTNGVPYVQTHAAVPPGSYVNMVIEFYSPLRIQPNATLRAELVPPVTGGGAALFGTGQHINRGVLLANKTFMVEFATVSNRVYAVQYSSDLVNWKSAQPSITGTGNWVQFIDNGEPKTESAPATQRARFYRIILLP